MKKYRLTKEYPGSPVIGTIQEVEEENDPYESYSQYWEDITGLQEASFTLLEIRDIIKEMYQKGSGYPDSIDLIKELKQISDKKLKQNKNG